MGGTDGYAEGKSIFIGCVRKKTKMFNQEYRKSHRETGCRDYLWEVKQKLVPPAKREDSVFIT